MTLGTGSASNSPVTVSNISIVGTGTPSATSNGLWVDGGFNIIIHEVMVDNFGYDYHFQAYPLTGSGTAAHMTRVYGGRALTAYIWADSWPELRIAQARMGKNAALDYTPNEFILISGALLALRVTQTPYP